MTDPSRVLLASSMSLLTLVPACSEPVADGGSSSGTAVASTDATAATTAGTTTAGTTDMTSGTGTTTPATTDVASSGEPTTGGDVSAPSPWDGEPLPPETPGDWRWVWFPDAFCRDGSNTGLWVRYGEGDGLVIFFQGGGACFNELTCANNPANYDPWVWPTESVFHDDPALNPVGDWNMIFVPYCTGDVHAGDRTDQLVPGVEGVQQFVGYRNGAAFLERIVPTFSDVSQVLVTGSSAGGFGAGVQYDRIAHAFPHARVTLLDDSGPPLADDVLSLCLQQLWSDLWGFDDTLPQNCDDCFPSTGGGLIHLAQFLAEAHPDQRLGLISSTADLTIRFYFGYGADDCAPQVINIPAAEFEAGLIDARDNYLDHPAGLWGTYYVGDSDHHTWLVGAEYSSITVNGVMLVDWLEQLLAGEATHVGP